MKTKKSLFMILIMVLLLGIASPVSAKTVAKIGKKSYSSLQSAANAVKKGQTIKLQCNVNMGNKVLTLGKKTNYTLDLNKKTISNVKCIKVTKGSVTLKNGTIKVNPQYGMKSCALTRIYSGASLKMSSLRYRGSLKTAGNAKVTITSGTYTNMYIYNEGKKAKMNISGGTFSSLYSVSNNGTMNITGGKFTLYGAEDSGWTFYNGDYNNSACIYVCGGNFTFRGGYIEVFGGYIKVCSRLYTKFKNEYYGSLRYLVKI